MTTECPGSNTPIPHDVPRGHTAAVCPHCHQQVRIEHGRFRDHFKPKEGGWTADRCPFCGKIAPCGHDSWEFEPLWP
jgi:hypothetical protein